MNTMNNETRVDAMRAAVEALEKLDAALETAWKERSLPASVISGELVREYRSALSLLGSALEEGGEPTMKLHDNDIAAMQQLQAEHDRLLERWKDAPAYSQEVANLHATFKAWDSRVGKLVADGLFKRILAASPIAADTQGDAK